VTEEENNLTVLGTARSRTWLRRRFAGHILLSDEDRLLLQALWPRCAVCCNKLVDYFGYTGTRVDTVTKIAFTAECHGVKEMVLLSFDDLETILRQGIQGGVAFDNKLIEEQKKI
jgi:hypothetical protein